MHPVNRATVEGSAGNQTHSSGALLLPHADKPARLSPSMPKPLLSRKDLAAYLGVSERATYPITAEPWFPPALELSARVLRWRAVEVDAALAGAPRRPTIAPEPAQLQQARSNRKAVPA